MNANVDGHCGATEAKESTRRKYDGLAATYASRYRDPAAVARAQVGLVTRWGRPVEPGARVLELGCADGLVTEALAEAGYSVTGVDLSPAMVAAARRRLARRGLPARFVVADIDRLELDGPFDAVLGMMRSFFHYADDPAGALARLRTVSPKVLVDVNPRQVPIAEACRAVPLRWKFNAVILGQRP